MTIRNQLWNNRMHRTLWFCRRPEHAILEVFGHFKNNCHVKSAQNYWLGTPLITQLVIFFSEKVVHAILWFDGGNNWKNHKSNMNKVKNYFQKNFRDDFSKQNSATKLFGNTKKIFRVQKFCKFLEIWKNENCSRLSSLQLLVNNLPWYSQLRPLSGFLDAHVRQKFFCVPPFFNELYNIFTKNFLVKTRDLTHRSSTSQPSMILSTHVHGHFYNFLRTIN